MRRIKSDYQPMYSNHRTITILPHKSHSHTWKSICLWLLLSIIQKSSSLRSSTGCLSVYACEHVKGGLNQIPTYDLIVVLKENQSCCHLNSTGLCHYVWGVDVWWCDMPACGAQGWNPCLKDWCCFSTWHTWHYKATGVCICVCLCVCELGTFVRSHCDCQCYEETTTTLAYNPNGRFWHICSNYYPKMIIQKVMKW